MRIGDLLRARIVSGRYGMGSLLPTEGELCEEFAISRHTVREALRRLSDAGLIERRQGSGSRVVAIEPHQTYVHAMRSLDQLFQYASDTRFVIESMTKAALDPDLFPEIDGDPKDAWLVIRGLRLERDEDVAICVSTVLVNHPYAGVASDLADGSGAIYRRIEQRFGIEVLEVVQDLAVVPMPADAAEALGVTMGGVAVQVRRRYLGADETVILASINHHPPGRFSYQMHLRREGARGLWA